MTQSAKTEPYLDLFTGLLRWSDNKEALTVRENFFTAALIGVLNEDQIFARAFVKRLCRERKRFGPHSIAHSQISLEPRTARIASLNGQRLTCYPDLTLVIDSRSGRPKRLQVEVKLGAPEGKKAGGPNQLAKYLAMGSNDRLAYIRGFPQRVERSVLRNPRYCRPQNDRDHFLWSDFFPLVEDGSRRLRTGALHRGLLGLMKAQGFAPLDDRLPDLYGSHSEKAELIFQPFWNSLHVVLNAPDSKWVCLPPKTNAVMWAESWDYGLKLEFNPTRVPGALRIWVSVNTGLHKKKVQQWLLDRLPNKLAEAWRGIAIHDPGKSTYPAVSISIPFRSVLRGVRSQEGVEQALTRCALSVINALESIALNARRSR
jgi:hypothetical protein